jgi:hypothetical protein
MTSRPLNAPQIEQHFSKSFQQKIRPTTVGMLIGTMCSDQLCGADVTQFTSWD